MSGTEIPNHRAKMATSVPKGMAADEPSTQSIRFIKKKSAKTILWDKKNNTYQMVKGQEEMKARVSCKPPETQTVSRLY